MHSHERARTTSSRATLGVALLAVIEIAALTWTARAAVADLQALVTLSPPTPALGQHTVKILLRDASDAPIPGATILVAIESAGGRSFPGAKLREEAAGIYRGVLSFAPPGPAALRVDVRLPDGLWHGELPLVLGRGGRVAAAASLSLRHREDPSVTFLGWIVVGVFVFGITGIAVLGFRSFLDRGQPG